MSYIQSLGNSITKIDTLFKEIDGDDISMHDAIVIRVDEDNICSVARMYKDGMFLDKQLYLFSSHGDISEYLPTELQQTFIYFDESKSLAYNFSYLNKILCIEKKNYKYVNYDDIQKCSLAPKNKNITVSVATGCSMKCSFCSIADSVVEYFPVEGVVEEIKQNLTAGVKGFHINNHSFFCDLDYVRKFCDLLNIECAEFDFKWSCFLPPEKIISDISIIGLLKKSKLDRIEIGVENINRDIQDDLNLKSSKEDIFLIIEECKKEGVSSVVINYIIGSPLESRKTLNKTEEFFKDVILMSSGWVDFNIYFFYPDVKTRYSKAQMIEQFSFDYKQCIGRKYDTSQRTKYLTSEEVYDWKVKFSKEIYTLRKNVFHNLSPEQRISNLLIYGYGVFTQLWRYFNISTLGSFFEYNMTYERLFFLKDVFAQKKANHFTIQLYKSPVISDDQRYIVYSDPVITQNIVSVDLSNYNLYKLISARKSIADIYHINMQQSDEPEKVSSAISSILAELENSHLITYIGILN